MDYIFDEIEKKQQLKWDREDLFSADENGDERFYVLEMFAYPSGKMHMGHLRNYTLGDVIARYKRMKGFNVFHPFGWDSFGLPAENAAIERGLHPAEWTKANIGEMKKQLKRLGISYDWDRELSTCDEEYYRWNQWLFIKMYEKGLVYKKKAFVNWDVDSQTVLANEQVINGRSWRGGEVIQRELEQWFFKITDYADQLLDDHKELEGHWPERVLTMQKNWIGRSEGVELELEVPGHKSIHAFTTRLDTIFGITYVAISKNHRFAKLLSLKTEEIEKFIASVNGDESSSNEKNSKEFEEDEKKGIFTGHYAINPMNGERVPIWIANYVLDYGGGAVIGVPSHDERDSSFANKYGLRRRCVIKENRDSTDGVDFFSKGILANSEIYSGMDSNEAIEKIYLFLSEKDMAKKVINYRLNDWLISRQRYWGTPIPAIYSKDGEVVMEDESNLPISLPKDINFTGSGNPVSTSESFKNVSSPKLKDLGERETDTMDTFVDSSWYYLRFLSPRNNKEIFNSTVANKWSPVDLYIGGVEHAVMHLLYARFMHKVLRDLGLVDSNEPFKKYVPQGMVLANSYHDPEKKKYYSHEEYSKLNDKSKIVTKMEKMSKSKNNGVEPEKIIEKYGADAARMFILFAAPPEKDLEWNDSGVNGTYKFIKKVWKFSVENKDHLNLSELNENLSSVEKDLLFKMNQTIKRVDSAMEETYFFNVAIAAIMELFNALQASFDKSGKGIVEALVLKNLLLLTNPFAPHFTSELWVLLGFDGEISKQSWPTYSEKWSSRSEMEIAVQVNGKLRGTILLDSSLSSEEIILKAKGVESVKKYLTEEIKKEIYVKKRLVNFVV